MSERVLVTGGSGFIGSHLVEALIERDYEVRVLDNLSMGRLEWVHPAADFVEGDIRDPGTCRAAATGCSGVFHLAAMSRSAASIDNIDICTSNNVAGTQNVLTAAREAGVRKVVYSGSSTYYGNGKAPQSESDPPDFLNFYGLSKYVGEEYCRMFDKVYDLPGIVLRYFNVYGPRQSGEGVYALVLSVFLQQRKDGQPLTIHGTGAQRRDFVHVRDVAQANIRAFESTLRGKTYNVGTGAPLSVKEVADMISANQVHTPRRSCDAEVTHADLTRIEAELGWRAAVTFEEGLGEMLRAAEDACLLAG